MSLQLKNNSPFPEDQKGGILIMDSGIGSLSFLSSLNELLPDVPLIAFADQAFFPYGDKHESIIIKRIVDMAEKLISISQPSTILIACNTASTIVLPVLRKRINIPIVGIVPAIKPAAALSKSKEIALLATEATIARPYINELIKRHGRGCHFLKIGSTGLAAIAEEKVLTGRVDKDLIREELSLLLNDNSVDCLILGCTHFTFLLNEIREEIASDITILDPVLSVSKQVLRVNSAVKRKNAKNFLLLSGSHQAYSNLDVDCHSIDEIIFL